MDDEIFRKMAREHDRQQRNAKKQWKSAHELGFRNINKMSVDELIAELIKREQVQRLPLSKGDIQIVGADNYMTVIIRS